MLDLMRASWGVRLRSVCCAAGYLLDKTDSWNVIFGVVAAVYALGYAGFAAWGSGELQHYDDSE